MTGIGPSVREARREDLPRIVEMLADDLLGRQREVASDPVAPEYVTAFDAIAADPQVQLLVLETDGRVVGTLQLDFLRGLSRRGAERAQIEAVRVAREMRGRGLGHVLVQAAIERARQRGCRVVQLTTDLRREDAHRFYGSLGFEYTHAGMKLLLPDERVAPSA